MELVAGGAGRRRRPRVRGRADARARHRPSRLLRRTIDGVAHAVLGRRPVPAGRILLQDTWDCDLHDALRSVERLAGLGAERLLAGHLGPVLGGRPGPSRRGDGPDRSPASCRNRWRDRAARPDELDDLLRRPILGRLATTRPDGWPAVVPVWIEWDGTRVGDRAGDVRLSSADVRADPRVCLSVVDDDDPDRRAQLFCRADDRPGRRAARGRDDGHGASDGLAIRRRGGPALYRGIRGMAARPAPSRAGPDRDLGLARLARPLSFGGRCRRAA